MFPLGVLQESLKCPVCGTSLGIRYKDEMFIGHCDECQVKFTWYPSEEKPLGELDSCIKSRKCECEACKDRDQTL